MSQAHLPSRSAAHNSRTAAWGDTPARQPNASAPIPISVLGAGSWGTALAALACQRHSTLLWARNPTSAKQVNTRHQLPQYLPNIDLPADLKATDSFEQAVQHACQHDKGPGLIILGVPLAGLVPVCQQLSQVLPKQRRHPLFIVRTSKGFHPKSGALPAALTDAHLPDVPWLHSGTLAGPSFALEVAQGLPVALTIATQSDALAQQCVAALHGVQARIYRSHDVLGVEIGGALKNIIAIACGVSDGLQLGSNARAALITRGLAEIQRIGSALGGQPETFTGLTGLGDLVLTATGDLSRNRQVGLAIARGELEQILATGLTAEGVRCAQAVRDIARQHQVEVPVTDAVCAVLFEGTPPAEAVRQLLARAARTESKK